MNLEDFLISFHGPQKILIRGTPLWTKTGNWVQKAFDFDETSPNVNELLQKVKLRSIGLLKLFFEEIILNLKNLILLLRL